MSKFIGRRTALGIGKESARGTAVAASFWEKQVEVSIDDKIEALPNTAAFGQIEDALETDIVKSWSEGSITANVKNETIGLWLLSLMGAEAAPALVGGETIVYDHAFSVSNTNQHQSLTISFDDPVQDYRFPLAMVSDIEFVLETGKLAQFKVGFMARTGETATNTPAYNANDQIFTPQSITLKTASNVAGLGAASNINIKKASIKIEKNVFDDMSLGSVTPTDYLNRQFTVSGEIEILFENESDWKTYELAGTKRAMLIDLKNTGVTIGTAANPRLQIQLPKVAFTDLQRDIKNDDIVTQKVSFKGLYSTADTSMLLLTLRNLRSTVY